MANGQNKQTVDSLQSALQKEIPAAQRVETYLKLAWQYVRSDTAMMNLYINQALEVDDATGAEKTKIDALDLIGMSLSIRGKQQDAESKYKQALEKSRVEKYVRGEARAYGRIGTTYLFRGHLDTSQILFERAVNIHEAIGDKEGLGYCYQGLGTFNVFKGNFKEALNFYNKSLVFRKGLGDLDGQISTYLGIANTYAYQSLYSPALENYLIILNLINNGGSKRSLPNVINNIGNIYHSRQEYTKAISYYERSLKLYVELNDSLRIALSYKNLGSTTLLINEQKNAIEYLEKSLFIYEKLENRDGRSSSLYSLGEAYLAVDRDQESIDAFEESLRIRREIDDRKSILISLGGLSSAYLKVGRISESKRLLDEAVTIATRLGSLDELERVNRISSELEVVRGNYRKAYEAYKRYKLYNDSIQSEENTRNITRMEAEFEFQQERDSVAFEQTKLKLSFEEELRRKEIVNQSLFGGSILILIILALMYRSFLIKKEKNRQLHLKNEEILELRKTEKKMAEETLALKERELTTVTMLSHEKNSILQRLEDQIGSLTGKVDDRIIPDLKEIKRTIKSNLSEESWSQFTYQFEKVHPDFFKKLKVKYPQLTKHDFRLCAYIKVGMDNKEIASISNITTDGVKKSIYRLKKKMNLNVEDDIRNFMMNFE